MCCQNNEKAQKDFVSITHTTISNTEVHGKLIWLKKAS